MRNLLKTKTVNENEMKVLKETMFDGAQNSFEVGKEVISYLYQTKVWDRKECQRRFISLALYNEILDQHSLRKEYLAVVGDFLNKTK